MFSFFFSSTTLHSNTRWCQSRRHHVVLPSLQVPRWFPSAGVRCSARGRTPKSSAKWRECSRSIYRHENISSSTRNTQLPSPPCRQAASQLCFRHSLRLDDMHIVGYFWFHVFLNVFFLTSLPSAHCVIVWLCQLENTEADQTAKVSGHILQNVATVVRHLKLNLLFVSGTCVL